VHYTKLFQKILSSSVWNEDDKTRLVWVTMLAMQDERHVVEGSVGGLAHQARVSAPDCERAIERLSSPDPDDSSGVLEGARIERVQGGWRIVNGEAYRKARDEDERREYMRTYMQIWRRRKKESVNPNVNKSKPPLAPLSEVSNVSPLEQNRIEQNIPAASFSSGVKNKQQELATLLAATPQKSKAKPISFDELKSFVCGKLGLSQEDAASLWEHWKGNGFRNAGKAMVDWRSVASNWERRKIFFPSLQKK
jgi:hypothetical protein